MPMRLQVISDATSRLTMNLDEALTLLGAYGRYQLFVFFVISVFDNFPSIMHMSVMTFIGYEPQHRCKVSLCVACISFLAPSIRCTRDSL